MNTMVKEKEQIRYAGFWRRLGAYLIDYFIVGESAGSWFTRYLRRFLSLIILAGYLIDGLAGQTPGKAARPQIVQPDGTDIGPGNAVFRFIGYIVSSIIF